MSLELAFRDFPSAITFALAGVLVLHSGAAFAQSTPPPDDSAAPPAGAPDVTIETAPPAPLLPPGPAAASSAARMVRVHIDSPDSVDLGYRTERSGEFAYLCTSPCDVTVPKDGFYRILPTGAVRESTAFSFVGDGPKQTVRVYPASRWGFVGGIVLTAGGMVTFGLGVLVLLGDAIAEADGDGHYDNTGPAIAAIAGLAAAVGGAVLIVKNARTGVNVNRDSPTPDERPQSLAFTSSRRVESGPRTESGSRFEAAISPVVFPLLRIAF